MIFARLRPLPDPDHLPALDAAYLSSNPAAGLGRALWVAPSSCFWPIWSCGFCPPPANSASAS